MSVVSRRSQAPSSTTDRTAQAPSATTGGATRAPSATSEPYVDTTFASRSVAEHWLRGVAGLALVLLALALTPAYGAGVWLVALPALVLWRGCPTCWSLGLLQTRQVCALRRRP